MSATGSAAEVPISLVKCLPPDSAGADRNVVKLQGSSVDALLFSKIEEEHEPRVFTGYRYTGKPNDQYRWAVYEEKKRRKIIPGNDDPVRDTEWVVIRTWEEPAGHQTIETRSRQRVQEGKDTVHYSFHSLFGASRHSHTHYTL
jgi:hypothetical protein